MNKKKNCNSKYCKYLAAWIQCVNSIALIINSSVTHLWACFSRTNRNQTGPILTATVRFCFRNCPIFFFIAHANMQTVTMDFIEVIWNYSLVFRANSTKLFMNCNIFQALEIQVKLLIGSTSIFVVYRVNGKHLPRYDSLNTHPDQFRN